MVLNQTATNLEHLIFESSYFHLLQALPETKNKCFWTHLFPSKNVGHAAALSLIQLENEIATCELR